MAALSREAAGAKEEEARAREALATHRSEAAAELDKARLALREAEGRERSVREQLQVRPQNKLWSIAAGGFRTAVDVDALSPCRYRTVALRKANLAKNIVVVQL